MVTQYNSITFIQIGQSFVRKSEIESIDDTVRGQIGINTTGGRTYSAKGKEAKEILHELGFNEK